MRTRSRRRGQVIHRNKSAPQPLGRRRKGPRLILAALLAALSMALAGPALAAEAPPMITNLVPKYGTHLGGTSVAIVGEHFTGATAVRFGETNAASFAVESSTMITAVSPPGAEGTTVKVSVTTPAGTSETEFGLIFYNYQTKSQEGQPPEVFSVAPTSGPSGGGTTVVVKESGAGRVFFGFTQVSFKLVPESCNRITCEVEAVSPGGLVGTVDVRVENVDGLSPVTSHDRFTYPGGGGPPCCYHWYRSGTKLKEGTPVPIVMFGGNVNLEVQNALGPANCKTVAGGTIENPVGGGPGVGRTNSFHYYECKDPLCEKEVKEKIGLEGRGRQFAQNDPAATEEPAFPGWSDELEESTVAGVSSVREKIGEPWETYKTPSPPGMMRETEICEIASTKQPVVTAISEGELKPEIGIAKSGNLNGTSAAKPSTLNFNGLSTHAMHSEVAGETTYAGQLKYLGYLEQELITVKP